MSNINIDFPIEAIAVLDRLADLRGLTRSQFCMIAIGMMQVIDDGARLGFTAGLTMDRAKLDTVLAAPLIN